MKLIDVKLPEWAWLSPGEHDKDSMTLANRWVLLHIRTATVIEFFMVDDFVPSGDALTYEFDYTNSYGITERHIAILHYSLDDPAEIIKRAAQWYKDYMKWEDGNILADEIAKQN